jgi:hypothetical protein
VALNFFLKFLLRHAGAQHCERVLRSRECLTMPESARLLHHGADTIGPDELFRHRPGCGRPEFSDAGSREELPVCKTDEELPGLHALRLLVMHHG